MMAFQAKYSTKYPQTTMLNRTNRLETMKGLDVLTTTTALLSSHQIKLPVFKHEETSNIDHSCIGFVNNAGRRPAQV